MFELDEVRSSSANIKVIGIGGAGGNAVNTMIAAHLKEVEFIACNTDNQVLDKSAAPVKIQIGEGITRGLGAGADPQIGRQSALEDKEKIREVLDGSDMVFITAGMGGGTGTGAAPVIAEVSRELGILTVAVVTKPFFYEGKRRSNNAELGIRELNQFVDTMIVIPNDRIQLVVDKGTPLIKSFEVANDVLRQAVQGISDLILVPGLINLDFADVRTVMESAGKAVMGVGTGVGEGGLVEAARKAISNPLLENNSIEGARGILINITGGSDLSLDSVQDATELIYEAADDNAEIIFGAVIDPDSVSEVKVTVIATGFDEKAERIVAPQLERWKPDPIERWKPEKIERWKPAVEEPVLQKVAAGGSVSADRGAERVLSKSLYSLFETDGSGPKTDIMTYEDEIDIPTFSRKQS